LRRLLETDARIEGGEGVTAIVKELYMEDSGAIPDEVMPEAPATQAQKLTAAIGGEPAPSATEIVKDMAATVGAPEVMNEVEQTIKEVEKGPLFDEDGFKARVNQVVDQITAKTVAWSDIAKWVGPSGPEEITAANIANLEAYVSAYDPARAKKANKGR
jgi:phage terminase small subunit